MWWGLALFTRLYALYPHFSVPSCMCNGTDAAASLEGSRGKQGILGSPKCQGWVCLEPRPFLPFQSLDDWGRTVRTQHLNLFFCPHFFLSPVSSCPKLCSSILGLKVYYNRSTKSADFINEQV